MIRPVKKACLVQSVGRSTNPEPTQEGIEAIWFDDELGLLGLQYKGEAEPWAIPMANVKGFKFAQNRPTHDPAPSSPPNLPTASDMLDRGVVPVAPPAPVALIPRRRGRPPTKAPAPPPQAVPLQVNSGRTTAGPPPEIKAMLEAAAGQRAKSQKWASKKPNNGLAV